jgi:hypothetical protein
MSGFGFNKMSEEEHIEINRVLGIEQEPDYQI